MGARATRATQALTRAGVTYRLHVFEVAEKVGEGYGEAVAEAIGMPGNRVFKTLVAVVDDEPVVAVIPGRPPTLPQEDGGGHGWQTRLSRLPAGRRTGYRLRDRRDQPIWSTKELEAGARRFRRRLRDVAVSGGRRGVQLELAPEVVIEVTGGTMAAIADD